MSDRREELEREVRASFDNSTHPEDWINRVIELILKKERAARLEGHVGACPVCRPLSNSLLQPCKARAELERNK